MEIKTNTFRALRPVGVAELHLQVKTALRLATLGLDLQVKFGSKAGQGALGEKLWVTPSDLEQETNVLQSYFEVTIFTATFFEKGDISKLEKWVTFLLCVDREKLGRE